jgi:dienelactone hydrolase
MQPFVLPVTESPRQRDENIDVYWPTDSGGGKPPVVVFVHGGPVPAEQRPTPRDWPVYIGYGSLAASHGIVGVTVDHRLHSLADYPVAAEDVASAVGRARALPGVNADRVALWFFSGGGLLTTDWLAEPPPWLRCVAATYPLLAPLPGWEVDERFRPVDAVHAARSLPILLTRVGRERPVVAETVQAFVAEAEQSRAGLTVIDVPEGQHAFDILDHNEGSRAAVRQAMDWVAKALRR